MLRTILCAAIAAAAVAGVATAQDAPRPLGLELKPCILGETKAEARCGTFTVLEDRARPAGRRLPLEVVVWPARAAKPAEPIFLLSGGPGQAATEQAQYLADMPERATHDLVLMNVRGTGEATRLDCKVGADTGLQAYLDPIFGDTAAYRACRKALEARADLTKYTTPIAMQDLDDLRQAMGYDKIFLFGGSYGARAGFAYIRAHGAHVRGAFLSGIAAMENRSPLYHAAAAQRAFDRIAEQCRAEAACHAAYPDPQGDLDAIRATLRRTPARVKVKHPATGAEGELLMTEPGFTDGLRVMLYSEETGRRVPLLLQRARAGEYAPFAQAAVQSRHGFRSSLALGLLLSVDCPENTSLIRPDEIAREVGKSFIGDTRVRTQMAACREWPAFRLPASYYAPFVSDVPVVLVSGDLDPVTPPQWGEAMKRYFRHGVHVVVPGAHVSDSPCADELAHQLFEKGSTDGLDTSCVAKLRLPPFVLPTDAGAGSPSN